jgi:ABC-type lipoprotein export system ATPase subunit
MAFKDINLVFPNRGLILLTGESGSGKTSLLNCISGLDKFSDGEMFCSKALSFSFVFQDYQLIEDLTVIENLRFLIDLKYISSDNEIDEVLRKFGIYDVRNHMPSELSGGQKQRLSIVRAILQHSNVILADEPSGNLDSENSKNVSALLKEISKERLVIVASHEPSLFLEISDGYIQIEKGEIVKTSLSTQTDLTLDKPCQNSYRKLPLKSAFRIAFKGFRKTLPRMLITILLLVISLLMLLIFTTIAFNDEVSSSYAIFQEEGIQSIDYLKNADSGNNSVLLIESIYYDDYKTLLEIIDDEKSVTKFIDNSDLILNPYPLFNIDIQEVNIKEGIGRIYIDFETKLPLLYGKSYVDDYEIIITDYLLWKIFLGNGFDSVDYESVIGKQIYLNDVELTISGVIDTGFDNALDEYSFADNDLKYYECVFINDFSYYLISNYSLGDNYLIDIGFENYIEIKQDVVSELYEDELLMGYFPSKNNEIALSESFVIAYFGDAYSEDIIGNRITINYFKYSSFSENTIFIGQETFIISGIINDQNGTDYSDIYLSNTAIYDIGFKYSLSSYENQDYKGYSIEGITIAEMKMLHENGFIHQTYISDSIYHSYYYLNSFSAIFILLALILLVFTWLSILRFVLTSMRNKTNDIGVLTSLGIKTESCRRISMIEVLTLYTLSLFLIIPVTILIPSLVNNYLISINLTTIPIFLFSIYVILIDSLIGLIFSIAASYISFSKYISLNTTDLLKYKV